MGFIRIRDNGDVVTDQQFRNMYPLTNFPSILNVDLLDELGADRVLNGAQPVGEPWQVAELNGVEEIQGNWYTKFVLTPETLDTETFEQQRSQKLAELAQRRWERQVGGITFGGMTVKTDDETQRMIHGAYTKAQGNPNISVRWKLGTGSFVTLDAETIIAIGDAVWSHIQQGFDIEAELTDEILAATNWSELVAVNLSSLGDQNA